MDVVFVASLLALFGLTIGLIVVCDRLRSQK